MNPEVIILDEPCAGLDPKGRDEILSIIDRLHEERGITVMLVSHSMDDLADHVNRVLIMNDGRLMMDGTPRQVFTQRAELASVGLNVPEATAVMFTLKSMGLPVATDIITNDEAKREIIRVLGR